MVRRTMFDGMKLVDSIPLLKRIPLSVWCDARPRAEQDSFASVVARYERLPMRQAASGTCNRPERKHIQGNRGQNT